jgi:hypothetical protein
MEDLHIIKKIVMDSGVNILSSSRDHEVVINRWLYYTLAKEYTKYSLREIGEVVGRNHATVIYGLKQFENERLWDKDLQTKYERLSIICMKKMRCNNLKEVDKQIRFMHTEIRKLYEIRKELLDNELINAKQ